MLNTNHLFSVLQSLLRAEILAHRGPGTVLPAMPWDAALRITDQGLECDSLERQGLATAVNAFFHLHETGVEDALLRKQTLGEWAEIVAFSLARSFAHITFRTSGSTGTPKACRHRVADLMRETAALADLYGPIQRIIAMVPPHHIYGFLHTVLLPAHLNIPVIAAHSEIPFRHRDIAPGDLIVAFPERWQAVAASGALPAGVRGVTSTAPCSPVIWEAVAATGLEALYEIYGASETAGVGWRTDGTAPFTLFPYWRCDGNSVIDAAAPAQPIPLQDVLVPVDATRFRIQGRKDQAIQIGGINVFPAAVAARLQTHPLIQAAAVRMMRADEGKRLKAFVVLKDPACDLIAARREILDWITATLPTAEQPKAVTFGARLPCTETGKAADWEILADHEVAAS